MTCNNLVGCLIKKNSNLQTLNSILKFNTFNFYFMD